MSQYMFSVMHPDGYPTEVPDNMDEVFAAVDRFNAKLERLGAWVFGGGLEHPARARVVDATPGQATVTDGPFSEAKEVLGGFWVVEAETLDAALELAAEASAACAGPVEVRPFQPE